MNNKLIGLIFIVVGFYPFTCVKAQESAQEKPNILIILTDDQGYHDVSYYGTEYIQTPNIDRLVESGMRLDDFYANSSVCSPSRAALMSGRYPAFVGVPGVVRPDTPENSWGYLDPDATLLPKVLNQHGYNTALIGKWHLGTKSPNLPNDRGFDYFKGWLYGMMDDYWEHRKDGINYMRLNKETINPKGHATDLFTNWATQYTESQSDNNQPFFLYLAYTAPHTPLQPPKEWLEKVRQRQPNISETQAKLVALIEHMDVGVGKVVKKLKDTGQYDNTLIIFASDNGGLLRSESNNGPLRDGKGSMYEGGLKVPAGVSWPNHTTPGSNSNNITLMMDVFPTVLEAAGINYSHTVEGQSFLPTLLGRNQPKRKQPLYFSRREGGTRYGGLTIQAVQSGNWKLLQNTPFEPRELYNLKKDPEEQNNVADINSKKLHELNEIWMNFIQKTGSVPWQNEEGK